MRHCWHKNCRQLLAIYFSARENRLFSLVSQFLDSFDGFFSTETTEIDYSLEVAYLQLYGMGVCENVSDENRYIDVYSKEVQEDQP